MNISLTIANFDLRIDFSDDTLSVTIRQNPTLFNQVQGVQKITVENEDASAVEVEAQLRKLRFLNLTPMDREVLGTACYVASYKPSGERLDAARRLAEWGMLRLVAGESLYNGHYEATPLGRRFYDDCK